MHTHITKCMYECIQTIYTYIYTQNTYTLKHKLNLNAHSYLSNSYRKEAHKR